MMILYKLLFMAFVTVTSICTILWLFGEEEYGPDGKHVAGVLKSQREYYVAILGDYNKEHTKTNLAFNKQLKMLADELVKCNKRLKKLENK